MGYKPMPVFKTGAFNRSATSPSWLKGVIKASAAVNWLFALFEAFLKKRPPQAHDPFL